MEAFANRGGCSVTVRGPQQQVQLAPAVSRPECRLGGHSSSSVLVYFPPGALGCHGVHTVKVERCEQEG